MIAAICACRNEADIIEMSVCHILAEGADVVYISVGASSDGTAEIVESLAKETGRLYVRHDADPIFHQVDVMNNLATIAGADGARWIIPFDADEFPYALNGESVATILKECQHDKFYMRMYRHHDWNMREVCPKPLPKVVYRWSSDARLTMGQHDVSIAGGVRDVLALREWQYQSYDHFKAKRDLWMSAIDPEALARGDVWHYTRLANFNDELLQAEYDAMMTTPTVFDPIPTFMGLA